MLFRIAAAFGVLAVIAMPASGQGGDLVTKKSAHDLTKTVERLEGAIKSRGATIVAKVDHAAAAKANGLELPPTVVVIFGNPKLGTPLMQSAQSAGLDLPLKVLVWQDAAGEVQLSYWAPVLLGLAHGITDRDEVLKTMTGALATITDEAANP
jgi:uncharacterized protein (DUF302 family)